MNFMNRLAFDSNLLLPHIEELLFASHLLPAKLFPCAQHFADGPGLGDAAARLMRRIAIEYFRECAKAIGISRSRKRFEKSQRREAVSVYAKVRQREWTKKPSPHGSLVI